MRQMRFPPWRRLVRASIWLILWIAWWTPAIVRAQAPAGGDPLGSDRTLIYMLQNPLIRQFFLSQVTGRRDSQELRIDQFYTRIVDRRIKLFGEKVDRDLSQLLSMTDEALRIRGSWVQTRPNSERREAADEVLQ